MPPPSDRVLIVGAGLAGACAAAALAGTHQVTVVESGSTVASAASGVAAGLANPFSGRRASPAWRRGEALEILEEMIGEDGSPRRGILRPVAGPEQRDIFLDRVDAHPDELAWLSPEVVAERWPTVRAPLGALWVRRGIAIEMSQLIRRLTSEATLRLNSSVASVWEEDGAAGVMLVTGERMKSDVVILAPGDGFQTLPPLAELPLGRLKGQILRLRRTLPPDDLPVIAGKGYVIPREDSLVLGSTHERDFHHVDPTDAGRKLILERARHLLDLGEVEVVDERAGVRVTVPPHLSRRRLPMIGPLPGHSRVWGFIGLGSKGLMTAPLLASALPGWLADPGSISPEVRLRIAAGSSRGRRLA